MDISKSSVIRSRTRSGVSESMISNQACRNGVALIRCSRGPRGSASAPREARSSSSFVGWSSALHQHVLGVEGDLVAHDQPVGTYPGPGEEAAGGGAAVGHPPVDELDVVVARLPDDHVRAVGDTAAAEVGAHLVAPVAA